MATDPDNSRSKSELMMSGRSRTLVGTLVAAGIMAVFVVLVLSAAQARDPTKSQLKLLFPYLAAVAVFFTSCVWAILESHATVRALEGNLQRGRAAWILLLVGAVMVVVLMKKGLAGDAGLEAIRIVNCYLAGSIVSWCERSPWDQPWNGVGAFANTSAILIAIYLGYLGWSVLRSRAKPADASASKRPPLRYYSRAISEILVLASTILVTTTLTIYLLFAATDELKGVIPTRALSDSPDVTAIVSSVASSTGTTVKCTSLQAISIECTMSAPKKEAGATSASLAFVTGLAFSAALAFLFMTLSSAVDDLIQAEIEEARSVNPEFSVKTWLEKEGLADSTREIVFKALALLAPAATGTIALLTS